MELLVTLVRPDSSAQDIRVTYLPSATVADLVDALLLTFTELKGDDAADAGGKAVGANASASATATGTTTHGYTVEVWRQQRKNQPEGLRLLDPADQLSENCIADGSYLRVCADEQVGHRSAVVTIRIKTGKNQLSEFRLGYGIFTIGRGSDSDIRIDDPTVSKLHAKLEVRRDQIEIVDAYSANGIYLNHEQRHRGKLASGQEAVLGNTTVTAEWIVQRVDQTPASATVQLVRAPVVVPEYIGAEYLAPIVPKAQEVKKFPWVGALIPALMGAVMWAVTQSVYSVVFLAMSTVMLIATWFAVWLGNRRRRRLGHAVFQGQIDAFEQLLAEEADAEKSARCIESPGSGDILGWPQTGHFDLWNRRTEHDSFLSLRLGLAELPSRNVVSLPPVQNPPDPQFLPSIAQINGLATKYAAVSMVPVVEHLDACGGLGISGPTVNLADYIRDLTAQLVGLHAPDDMLLCGILGPRLTKELAGLRWLPHTRQAHQYLGVPALAGTADDSEILVSALEALVAELSQASGTRPLRPLAGLSGSGSHRHGLVTAADSEAVPAVVVLLDNEAEADHARLVRLSEQAPGWRIYPVWLAGNTRDIPAVCRTFVYLGEPGRDAQVGYVRTGVTVPNVEGLALDRDSFEAFCRKLAGVRDASSVPSIIDSIPREVPLSGLLGSNLLTAPDAVIDRWSHNGLRLAPDAAASGIFSIEDVTGEDRGRPRVARLSAAVGLGAAGPIHLDLRQHGPHALVGGTTGSGKSEFLQAWVLSLAASYSPQQLVFLFFDYKGGSAFAECTQLPHSVGLVTDLTPSLVQRALTSLRAELQYRERLLNRKGVRDITELESQADADTPPVLVLVIDEFATLVGDVPEFFNGVIDVAQRGRSLGIHLIMATQRPAGVIKDNLRANTNLRIALRVADGADSTDVIGTVQAAALGSDTPGRGLIKVGSAPPELFQSAYTAGISQEQGDKPPVSVGPLYWGGGDTWHHRSGVFSDQGLVRSEAFVRVSDQQRLVANIKSGAQHLGLGSPRKPWLPELPHNVPLTDLAAHSSSDILLGLQDEPDLQRQSVVGFNPEVAGHLAVFGASGSGKTTVLRTLVAGLQSEDSNVQSQVYGLDFAGGALQLIDGCQFVGAVIGEAEGERLVRFFYMMQSELKRRKQRNSIRSGAMVSGSSPEAGLNIDPRIFILIDGFSIFRREHEPNLAANSPFRVLFDLLAQGRAVGMHVVITVDRPQGVPPAMMGSFGARVVMRLSDTDSYFLLGAPKDGLGPDAVPGRAIISGRLSQIAMPDADPGWAPVADNPTVSPGLMGVGQLDNRPPPVLTLPDEVGVADLPDRVSGQATLGISGETIEPLGWKTSGVFVIAGPGGSGRTNSLLALAASVRSEDPERRIYFLSPFGARDLLRGSQMGEIFEIENISELARQIDDDRAMGHRPCVFVDSVADFVHSSAEAEFLKLVRRAKRGEILLVVEGETSDFSGGFGLVGALKSARRGVILAPDPHDAQLLFRVASPVLPNRHCPPGRGIYVSEGKAVLVQIPLVAA